LILFCICIYLFLIVFCFKFALLLLSYLRTCIICLVVVWCNCIVFVYYELTERRIKNDIIGTFLRLLCGSQGKAGGKVQGKFPDPSFSTDFRCTRHDDAVPAKIELCHKPRGGSTADSDMYEWQRETATTVVARRRYPDVCDR